MVRLGEYDLSTKNETLNVDLKITKIILHPEYNNQTQANDIALVSFYPHALYNSFIQPICLPKDNMDVYHKIGIVAGKINS